MPIGDPYATGDDLKSYLFKQQEAKAAILYPTELDDCVRAASQQIEQYCNRQFNKETTATARVFEPATWKRTYVDDFWTTADLVVKTDSGGVGSFDVTWDSSDFELSPFNGVVGGVPGWPYSELRACRGLYFPRYARQPYRRRAVVQVTAQWGWTAVPGPVKQACLIMAAETWKLRNAPFGVAGFTQFGGVVKVRDNPMAFSKLCPYVLDSVNVG